MNEIKNAGTPPGFLNMLQSAIIAAAIEPLQPIVNEKLRCGCFECMSRLQDVVISGKDKTLDWEECICGQECFCGALAVEDCICTKRPMVLKLWHEHHAVAAWATEKGLLSAMNATPLTEDEKQAAKNHIDEVIAGGRLLADFRSIAHALVDINFKLTSTDKTGSLQDARFACPYNGRRQVIVYLLWYPNK